MHSTYISTALQDTTQKIRDFLLFTGTIQKTAESAEARRENNTSLRLSASSAVNLFYHDPFIQNKLKIHKNTSRIRHYIFLLCECLNISRAFIFSLLLVNWFSKNRCFESFQSFLKSYIYSEMSSLSPKTTI